MSEWFSFSLLYYLSEWAVRVVMLFVIPRRRHPSAAMAWLLVIFFLPWPGLALYWLIGSNRLPRRRIMQHTRMLDRLRAASQRLEKYPNIGRPELGSRAMEAVKLAEHLGYMPILGGNDVELIAETETFIDRLTADIDAARSHVHLLFYIFVGDGTGQRVIDALTRAVHRGVKCRVLVDGVGSRQLLKRWGKKIRAEGIELHEALPVGIFRRRMARLDLRNHRKLAVIDGRIGYTGSQNIVDAGYGHKDLAWHDLMLRLRGPILLELQEMFVTDWHFETDEVLDDETIFPDPEPAGAIAVQTLPSGPNYPTENYQRMVVAAIHAAERRVTITTPYFVPDDPFLQALETAVLRGVEVELVMPRKLDQRLVAAASRSYWDDLLEMGVKLYLYDKGLLHAKTMCVDESIAFIGSSNFDIRSFALNFEINLLFYGREVAAQLRRQQDLYLRDSFQLTADRWAQRPTSKMLFQNIARLLSPLL
ncbi:MAG: cardiolipin synthase [Pirellulales bacterium]|nr:cardiolipin synthase [Pirellulales bacterium]